MAARKRKWCALDVAVALAIVGCGGFEPATGRIGSSEPPIRSLAFSADGQRIFIAFDPDPYEKIRAFDLDGSAFADLPVDSRSNLPSDEPRRSLLRTTRDGKFVVVVTQARFIIHEGKDPYRVLKSADVGGGEIACADVRPDGSELAVCGSFGVLRFRLPSGLRMAVPGPAIPFGVLSLVYSDHALAWRTRSEVGVNALDGGRSNKIYRRDLDAIAFDSKGRELMLAREVIERWGYATDDPPVEIAKSRRTAAVVYVPAADRLVAVTHKGLQICRMDGCDDPFKPTPSYPKRVNAIVPAPDAGTIAYSMQGYAVGLLDVENRSHRVLLVDGVIDLSRSTP